MAIRFAKQNGDWSDPNTWDGGLTSPTTGDDVYSNGYTVTLDQDVNVGCLNGGTCPQGVPLSPIPDMTNNTTPAGVGQAFAVQNNATAWQAFKKPITNFTNTGWQSTGQTGQLGFQFNTPKNIQRYSWYVSSGANQRPRNWTFEGSNDGVTYVVLHTVTAYASLATYFSPVISNPSSYLYYRINVSTTQTGAGLYIDYLDMTESTDLGNGYSASGQFNSNVNRTITCTGFGIIRPSFGTNQVVNIIGNTTTTTITGNIIQYNNDNTTRNGIITIAGGTNTVNITGDVYIDAAAIQARGSVISSTVSTNVINIVGNVYSYSTNTTDMRSILHANILNITGNVTNFGGADTTTNRVIAGSTITTVHNITGNIIGPTANGGYCIFGGILNLTGNLTCTAGIFPISVNRLRISPSTSISFRLQDTTNADRFMYTDAQNIGQAAEADVRDGTVYGPNNDYTGTCAIPPTGSVALGVPVDNTVGTAYIEPTALAAAFFTQISSSADPLAQRMRNQATVQTTGDQIAALS